ncbi:MAG: hypothetical protein LAKADJCE_00139 [Candidatus Argoarchaeum ethanivorans]|uniref:Uncharacterized protein n=1 Tax=Candidatus Argoarchaeum ethanivorans TaxID=2608793 RepID=A0A811T368_9EURY|nr:MAG: hypothetical protein LAKADJCE_00139 [Candidatus Argoarchaeum ethanivorans]
MEINITEQRNRKMDDRKTINYALIMLPRAGVIAISGLILGTDISSRFWGDVK